MRAPCIPAAPTWRISSCSGENRRDSELEDLRGHVLNSYHKGCKQGCVQTTKNRKQGRFVVLGEQKKWKLKHHTCVKTLNKSL